MNTGALSFQITVFSGCISRSKTAGPHDSSIAGILLLTVAAPVYIPVNGLSVWVPFLHVLTMLCVCFFLMTVTFPPMVSVCGVPFLHVLTILCVCFFFDDSYIPVNGLSVWGPFSPHPYHVMCVFSFDDRNSERCEVLN